MNTNMRRQRRANKDLRELRDMIRQSSTQTTRNDLQAIAARSDPANR